jgi:antitoxin (DNA-binding transcriptional repressor) of toxin-antitoxin stability system
VNAVSLKEAKEHLDELVEEAAAGGKVVIALDERLSVRLERVRRWHELSSQEKADRKKAILAFLAELDALPVPDLRSAREVLADEHRKDDVFGWTLEVKVPMDEKSGIDLAEVPAEKVRIFGLDQGKFVVPDDFDDPMPEIEQLFYASH